MVTPNRTTPTPAPQPAPPADLAAIKARQQATWAAGDYAVIGTTIQIVAENLCETADLRAGSRVLDVAAGHGNVALAAARRFCEVVGVDYVPSLLDRGRERARADRLPVTFHEGDAENLPFADGTFDAVMSVFGAMFTPDPERCASEMLRVCRSGGTIALANWTPDGFIGRVFKIIGRYVPPAPGVKPPALWGTRERLDELFGESASSIGARERVCNFRYRSPEHWLETFRSFYGPTLKTFAALEPGEREALAEDILRLLNENNRANDGTLVVPSTYLEVVVVKR